jgi:predicted transposase YbfD/YdcC
MNLDSFFNSIDDFRRSQGQRFELSSLLWIIFLGIASGYKGYRPIAKFAKANNDFFVDFFKLKHPVPSHVTFRAVLTGLDKKEVIKKFNEWSEKQDLQPGDWISGDGKSLKSTVVHSQQVQQDFSSVVSLYCQRTGLSFQIKDYQNKKISEGQVLRDLLPSLKDKGVIITLDALHTQKKTLSEVVDSGNHYVCQVKKNTPHLLATIQEKANEETPVSEFEISEKGHGRETTWHTEVFTFNEEKIQDKWVDLRTFIVINKTVKRKDKNKNLIETKSISYRISDVSDLSAELFFKGIRGHWGVENRTHWVKDVILNEDNNGIRDRNGAVNMATFNTVVINFLRQHIDDSIKAAQIIFGQSLKEQLPKIRT